MSRQHHAHPSVVLTITLAGVATARITQRGFAPQTGTVRHRQALCDVVDDSGAGLLTRLFRAIGPQALTQIAAQDPPVSAPPATP
jgi:hypothetical protein